VRTVALQFVAAASTFSTTALFVRRARRKRAAAAVFRVLACADNPPRLVSRDMDSAARDRT